MSRGSFLPTTRILVFGQAGNDEIELAGSIAIAAWLYGGSGNDRLKGGAGNDLLFGEEGDDLLVGNDGRDFLVGGLGADRIVGNADDDILIGGFTVYDDLEAALYAIMAEWGDTQTSYYDRTTHLANGIGPGNSLRLDRTTVSRDGAVDVLTGSSGLDWFLFDIEEDHDRATDLHDEVFASDLDWITAVI